jgi:short-subunit dehydrogenase
MKTKKIEIMKYTEKEKTRLRTRYGKWAVITGASSGIGMELTWRLAEAGLDLIITARGQERLRKLADELQETYDVEVIAVPSDVSTIEGVNRVLEVSAPKDVGLFVASAGYGTAGSFLDSSIHSERNMLQVNCDAVLSMTHHFSQVFSQRGKGGIVLFSSLVAFQGVPYSANYAATKAYIQSLAEALYVELKPSGVDVLAAAPGPVNSGFAGRANMKMGNVLKPEDVGIPILKALGRRSTVLPGTLSKVLIYSLRTLPRWAKVRAMKVVMGGMTKHQRQDIIPNLVAK